MIDPAALKPHLLHEDRLVRDAVAEYFEKSWSRDPDLVPLLLSAVERYGAEESRGLLSACASLVLTAESLEAVAHALADARDPGTALLLNRVVAGAPARLLAESRECLLAGKNLTGEARTRIHRRIQLSRWQPERLWKALVRLAKNPKARYADGVDLAYVGDLVEALADHAEPSAERICELLDSEQAEGWVEIFAIDLAGARSVRAAVPALVEKLHVDTDYMLDRAVRALARIGDPSAVGPIRAAFPAASWDFKCFATGVLSDLKSAECEEAAIALLAGEEDPGIRVMLCLALCEQISARGLPLVCDEIRRGYDRSYASLEEAALPVAELLGVRIPEADAWREALERDREAFRERQRQLDEWSRTAKDAEDGGRGALAELLGTLPISPSRGLLEDDEAEPLEDVDGFAAEDEEREEEPIARNAPCPCGSGRKFKRCCGRDA